MGRDDPVPNCLILHTSLRDSVLINRGYQLLNINAVWVVFVGVFTGFVVMGKDSP